MSANFCSRSPADDSIVWTGPATPQIEVEHVMERASAALVSWRRTSFQERIECVQRYAQRLQDGKDEIASLISREVGKLPWDAAGEVAAAIAKIGLSVQALEQRRSGQWIESGSASGPQRRIRYHPIGVTLVLGPFNFPLHLPGGQIIPALLAGNTVVFKPSEQATAVGQWMMRAWEQAGLPPGVIQMICGGVKTATSAIDSPHVGAIFLTGSRSAGRAIHRQLAGRPHVLLALELGGNNPIVISHEVTAETAAAVVSFSSFVSSGQRCTCARRAIFVQGNSTRAQIDALIARTRNLSLGMPGDHPSPQVGPLISVAAADSLRRSYEQLLQLGCHRLVEFEVDGRAENLVRPAIVDASDLQGTSLRQLGEMEWFGPLLVVQTVSDFAAALRSAATTSYGLAASLLGGTDEMFQQYVASVGAGVVNWNGPTTGAAGSLPFGGLGDSGNHRPAGYFAIDFCSDPIASLEHDLPPAADPWVVAQ